MKHFAGLIASAALVAGHGYVTNGTIGGSSYEFYQPYTDPYTSPTPERISRPIQGNGPVTDLSYADLQCGGDTANGIVGSSPANLTADVTAGSDVNLYWTLWPSSHVGPTITYMAKCDNDDCTTFMPGNDSVWFKVQEDGRDGTSDTWGATAVMTAGGYITYTVPECIESGAYLVRHEIIALHSAGTEGGAQFYPGCHQITVSGGGSTTPSDVVAFPGAYSPDDAGILYDVYTAQTYTVPGPSLFTCSGSSSSSSSSGSSSSGSSASASAGGAAASTTTGGAAYAASTLTTVTRASSAPATSSSATTETALAAQITPSSSSSSSSSDDSGDDDTCAEETVTSTVAAAQAEATGSAGDDGEDDGCDAEGEGSDDGSSTTTGAASGSDSSSSSSSGTTGSDSSSSSSSAASSGDDGEDDGCDAEGEAPTATATGAGSQAQPTGSYGSQPTGSASTASGSDSGDECDAEEEQAYAARFRGADARLL